MAESSGNSNPRDGTANGGEQKRVTSAHGFTHNPIASASEDRLGRYEFARILGRALVEYPDTGSLVVALYGDWGSGKTSTLNMAFETVKESVEKSGQSAGHDDSPLVMWFNPWWYSNTGELLMRFFEQLGENIGQDFGEDENGGRIKAIITRYGRLLTPLGGLADLIGGAGAGTVIARIMEQGLTAVLNDAENGTAVDIRDLREEISEALRNYGRTVIVVIDDIDRLTHEEIRDVFKLVKAVADFPNTRYLLAFDRATVVGALSGMQGLDGSRYLEKIVQVPFSLPEPYNGQLWELAVGGVEEIARGLPNVSVTKLVEAKQELKELAYYGLDVFFSNIRQVNRFLGSLEFTLPPVAAELRLLDFVLLEMLRLNHAAAYEQIIALRKNLVGTTPGADVVLSTRADDRQEKAAEATRETVEVILNQVSENLCDSLGRLLENLFPRAKAARRQTSGYGRHFLDEWTAKGRVCVPENFRIATGWNLRSGMISAIEVEQLLAIRDPDQLRERLVDFQEDLRPGVDLDAVLRRLGASYRSAGDQEALKIVILALLGMDVISESHSTVYALAMDALERLPDSRARKQVLLDWVQNGGVTPILVQVLSSLGRDHGWYGDPAIPDENRRLHPDDFRPLLDEVSAEIAGEASTGVLLDRALFNEYLYLWGFAEGDEKPTGYLDSVLEEESGVLEIVEGYRSRSSSAFDGWVAEYMRRSNGGLRVQLLEDFGLLDKALVKARRLLDAQPPWLEADQRSLLEAFVLYYENHTEGPEQE